MTSADNPGQPASPASATGTARPRRVDRRDRCSSHRPAAGIALADADVEALQAPRHSAPHARQAGADPARRRGRPRRPVIPQAGQEGGVANPRRPPRRPATFLRVAVPPHLSYSPSPGLGPVSLPCRQPLARRRIGSACRVAGSFTTALGRPAGSIASSGGRSCASSRIGRLRPPRQGRGWTPRSPSPRHPHRFHDNLPCARRSERRGTTAAPARGSSSAGPAHAASQQRCMPPVSRRSAPPPPADRRVEAEHGPAPGGVARASRRASGAGRRSARPRPPGPRRRHAYLLASVPSI
jgi:hypothetical protein